MHDAVLTEPLEEIYKDLDPQIKVLLQAIRIEIQSNSQYKS